MSHQPKQSLDPNQIRRDLEVNPLDLDTAMIRQPGLFAHYAQLTAKYEREASKYEQFVDVTEARLDREIRDRAAAAGTKYTESQIKNMIRGDPRMIQVQMKLNEARENASVAKSTAEAFRHRRDMLVQLAFNAREEQKGAMRVMGDPAVQHQQSIRQARVESLRAANREE